jgi:hypothetical protein
MTIFINPATFVINVPKADLTLIQSTPNEIRELDSNLFRHWLDDWMDSEDGIYLPKTHVHNTVVTIDGLDYARTIEVLTPYTVTFEDAQYQVNIVGSNNNIHSRRNPNQVSLVPSNSAGLVGIRATEDGAYDGRVVYDPVNGVAGTGYPIGTYARPSNNVADAKLIAQVRGLGEFQLAPGNYSFGAGDDLSGFVVCGSHAIRTFVQVAAATTVTDVQFEDLILNTSTLDGNTYLKHCVVSEVGGFFGFAEGCVLTGNITITPNTANTYFVDCKSGCVGLGTTDLPKIDLSAPGTHNLAFRNWAGPIKFVNSTNAANTVCLDVGGGGEVIIDSTCTAGMIYIRGVSSITNTSGMTVLTDAQISKADMSAALLAAAQATPVWADIRKVNNVAVTGAGTVGNEWGPA